MKYFQNRVEETCAALQLDGMYWVQNAQDAPECCLIVLDGAEKYSSDVIHHMPAKFSSLSFRSCLGLISIGMVAGLSALLPAACFFTFMYDMSLGFSFRQVWDI